MRWSEDEGWGEGAQLGWGGGRLRSQFVALYHHLIHVQQACDEVE